MPDEMDICLVCLRTDLKLSQVINPRLINFHKELCDYSYNAVQIGLGDPKYCLECEHLLRKLYNFKEKCVLAVNILQTWKMKKDEKKPFNILYTLLPQSGLGLWMSSNIKTLQLEGEPRPESKNSLSNTEPVLNIPQLELAPNNNKPWLVTNINVLKPTTLLKINEPMSLEPNVTVPRSSGTSVNVPRSSGTRANVPRSTGTRANVPRPSEPSVNKLRSSGTSVNVPRPLTINENVPKPLGGLIETPIAIKDIKLEIKCEDDLPVLKLEDGPNIQEVTLPFTENVPEDKINIKHVNIEVQIKEDPETMEYPDDTSLKSDDASETDYTNGSILNQVGDIKTDLSIKSDDIQEIDKAVDDSSLDSDDDDKVKENKRFSCLNKKSLAELANRTLSDDDFMSNDETDIEDKEANVSDDDHNEEWTTANKIIADMEDINAELDSINDYYDKVLVKSDAVSKNDIDINIQNNKKHSRNVKDRTIIKNEDTDAIQINCENRIEHEGGLSLHMRIKLLKEDLRSKFESCGELTSVNGVVIDKEHVLNCIDGRASEYLIQDLWRAAYEKAITQQVIDILESVQNKYKKDKFESVFDIEYMNTPEAMREEFERRKTYEWYIKAKHKCELCYTVFKYEKLLTSHKKMHDESAGDHVCPICGVRHKLRKDHKHHMLFHNVVYKCKQCPLVTYYYKATVANHFYQHKGMKYRCELCDKNFSSSSSYKTHRTYRHRRAHACSTCGRTFETEETLNTHMKTHPVKPATDDSSCVKCDKCELSFPSQAVYERHIRFTHSAPLLVPTHKTKKRKKDLEKPRIKDLEKPRIKKKAAHTCPECNAVGGSYGWLVLHGRLEHNKDLREVYAQNRKYLCDYCNKGFATKYILRDHLYTHTGERPFACDSCSKRFHSSTKLQNHRQCHLPPSHACAQCGKKFRTQANLYCHTQSHIGDRRHKCNICGKGFALSNSLKEHIRGVHDKVRRKRNRGASETKKRGVSETGEIGLSETGEIGLSETGEIGLSETGEIGVTETRKRGLSETGEIGVSEAGMSGVTITRVARASTVARKKRRKVRKVVSSADEIGDSD